MHSKLPPYLGAISILICFTAVAISFGLAFIVIPRQVMPWTGLLLMYEWIFVTFFLMFESYLHVVCYWGNATASQLGYGNPDSSEYHTGKGVLQFYWLAQLIEFFFKKIKIQLLVMQVINATHPILTL